MMDDLKGLRKRIMEAKDFEEALEEATKDMGEHEKKLLLDSLYEKALKAMEENAKNA